MPKATKEHAGKGCAGCQQGHAPMPFTMAFQPVVDVVEQRIVAQEALVRGLDGQGAGHVLAQLTPENLYAFDQACRVRAIEMAARLGLDRQLNINFLPNAVYEPKACIKLTLEAAARTGFPLDRLTFEIVETETIAQAAHLANIAAEYRRHGFRIALDDFGTGHSGLLRLADLKPDIIKLDRALVADCDQDATRRAILARMVGLGADLGIKIVAEGVERREEVVALRTVGIRFIQGYFFAKPRFEALTLDADIFAGPPAPLARHEQPAPRKPAIPRARVRAESDSLMA